MAAIWRAWHGTGHLVLWGAGVAVLNLWNGPVDVPGRDDVAQLVWPLAPTFLAVACLTGVRCAQRAGERLTPRGAPAIRSGYVAAVALFAVASVLFSGPTPDRWVLGRNAALLCGLALGCAEVLPPSIAWTPLVMYPIVTWLVGSNGLGRPPEPWAILLYPSASGVALAGAVIVLAGGIAVFVGRPLVDDRR